ncbi:MAG: biopolymer transporter ExbD [Rhizobiaceae bacterium]
MRIEATLRRRRPLSLTSLIDVIFLLLLFFMLSSTFTRFGEVAITGGRATAAGDAPDVMIRLSDNGWSVNGHSFDEAAAVAELDRLKEAGARTAVLMVRGAVNSQQLVSAVERIGRQSGLSLSVTR